MFYISNTNYHLFFTFNKGKKSKIKKYIKIQQVIISFLFSHPRLQIYKNLKIYLKKLKVIE